MSTPRVNVLIYAGPGTTLSSIRHTTHSLRQLLGPHHAVSTLSAAQLLAEPWPPTCALLVLPGGADAAYCRVLDGAGNARIRRFVAAGGAYLGLCAGGYYGSGRCEFEVGRGGMEVVGGRELGFFPGVCRGLAFGGFVYGSEEGARAVRVRVRKGFGGLGVGRVYYNGGGVFVDAETYAERGVEVLASYAEELSVEAGEGAAAVVYCKVGEGGAILTGPHPEFAPANLQPDSHPDPVKYARIIADLAADDTQRVAFMKACLTKLGLQVAAETTAVPSLSPLHLSSAQPLDVAELVSSWDAIVVRQAGGEQIEGENDMFVLERASGGRSVASVAQAVADVVPIPSAKKHSLPPSPSTSKPGAQATVEGAQADPSPLDRPDPDYNALPNRLVLHETSVPDARETPHFNHAAYFAHHALYQSKSREDTDGVFGKFLLYGEAVTSTNTLLEKNPSWLAKLPIGLTATATTQLAGRGRGNNVWVSPPGSLMFSTVLRHSLALSNSAPVVFVQYLAALAVVGGIHSYGRGYEKLPVRLKWPNDIYARNPHARATGTGEGEQCFVKIGGVLINSSYAGGDYTLVAGVGLNVRNAAPTTALAALAAQHGLPPLALEPLLASILARFEHLYARFCRTGFDAHFEEMYYAAWLHAGQIVTLETEGGARARIKGISRDWGLLVVEELGWADRATGRIFTLQSDSNSFDFFQGLLKRKA